LEESAIVVAGFGGGQRDPPRVRAFHGYESERQSRVGTRVARGVYLSARRRGRADPQGCPGELNDAPRDEMPRTRDVS
jgi:hypothetical protein